MLQMAVTPFSCEVVCMEQAVVCVLAPGREGIGVSGLPVICRRQMWICPVPLLWLLVPEIVPEADWHY